MACAVKGNSPSSKIKPLKQAASVWGMMPTAAVIRALQQDGRAMTQHDCPFSETLASSEECSDDHEAMKQIITFITNVTDIFIKKN